MPNVDKRSVGLLVSIFASLVICAMVGTAIVAGLRYYFPPPVIGTEKGFRHVATQIITKQLPAPQTATFAPDEEWSFGREGENAALMRAWVEAEDKAGGRIRKRFTVLVEYDGVDYWEVKYLKFDGDD